MENGLARTPQHSIVTYVLTYIYMYSRHNYTVPVVAACCGVLRVAVCCSVLQCVAVTFTHDITTRYLLLQRVAVCCVLQCVAVCCRVLQCVAVIFTQDIATRYLFVVGVVGFVENSLARTSGKHSPMLFCVRADVCMRVCVKT